MSSESYHEPIELLSEGTKNLHRAIVSLREELEAVDWYQQRAEACSDDELRAVLTHNKNEEIEHAMMTLEWLRRNDPTFAANIAVYLNSSGPITEVEKQAEEAPAGGALPGGDAPRPADGSLGIGSLLSLARGTARLHKGNK
jgi:ferritin-like protein